MKLWFNTKEIEVYVYLVEYGISPASEIWKQTSIPKSTVNFIADNLWKKWVLRKTFRLNTGYYEADIDMLEKNILWEVREKQSVLTEILPELKEKNKNTLSKPKILFFDGKENCKQAYRDILKTKNMFFEFGAHADLEEAFGKGFMNDFIQTRVKKNIFCDSIGSAWEIETSLQKKDTEHVRKLQVFSQDFGSIYSSIAIYDNKVLLLNLRGSYSGVLVENSDFAETMKTIYRICASAQS